MPLIQQSSNGLINFSPLSVQDNQCLQGRLAQVNSNEEKSIHEELSILEEVRWEFQIFNA